MSEKYWPYGGAELATHSILKLLRDEGFDITVVGGTKRIEHMDGVQFIYSPSLDAPSKIRLWSNLISLIKTRWLNKLIEQSDIVYITRLAYPVIPLARRYNKKVIVHLHNYQPITYCSVIFHPYDENSANLLHDVKESLQFEIRENESIYKALLSSLFAPLNKLSRAWVAEADEVVCVSKRQAEIIKRAAPNLAKKMRVIPNPLPDVPYINKHLKEPRFLYVGGSSFCKGVHILAEASFKLLKRNNCKFTLINMTSKRWQLLFEEYNNMFNESFSIFNRLSYQTVLKMHSETLALIFPSICEEPLPYSVLEAMLSGTIPLASWTGGIPEIVQGTFAEKMLFTPGNAEDLVDRMETVLSLSSEQLLDIGLSLRQKTLRKFKPEGIRKELLKVFS